MKKADQISHFNILLQNEGHGIIDPEHDRTKKIACAPSEDSDSLSLIRVCAQRFALSTQSDQSLLFAVLLT